MNSATMDSGQRFIEIVGDLVDPTHHIISIEGSSTDGADGIMIESDSFIDHETVLPDENSDAEQLVIDAHNQLVVQGNHHQLQLAGQTEYVTIKTNGTQGGLQNHHHHPHHHQDMGLSQVVLPDNIINEMVVEQNIEVGSEDQSDDVSTGEIILVPNNYCFKQELMDANEVVVGATLHAQNVGNEIEIDEHETYATGRHLNIGLDDMDASDEEFDESALVIDTGKLNDDYTPITYNCGECNAILKSRTSLQKHIKKYHASQDSEPEELVNKTHNCPACPYHTPRRDKLDKHMCKHIREGYSITGKKRSKRTPPLRMRHTPEEYKCNMCPYKCTIEKSFRKHQKMHGGQGKQYVVKVSCKICGKDRPTEADLRKHMKKHKDGKDFLCDVCGFASIQMKKIIQHRRMHTGEKPHLCPHCSYRSARRDNLRSHVRRMHKKENMYIDTFNPKQDANGNPIPEV